MSNQRDGGAHYFQLVCQTAPNILNGKGLNPTQYVNINLMKHKGLYRDLKKKKKMRKKQASHETKKKKKFKSAINI